MGLDQDRARQRVRLFDAWAERYDTAVIASDETFPFAGYQQLLAAAVQSAQPQPGMRVLDLGIGTGNLAAPFLAAGCQVWGLDFSAAMLAQARARLPQLQLVQADLRAAWPLARRPFFDRIVSAYVLHEFDLPTKISLLRHAAADHLAPNGLMVVADIAFATTAARTAAAQQWADLWDDEEFYWAADETRAAGATAGLQVTYRQISSCAGLFTFRGQGRKKGA
jgi:putative AdoMet-dependent methyltransferase